MSEEADSYAHISNVQMIEHLHAQYVKDPTSVDSSWRAFFDGMEFAGQRESGKHHPGLRILRLLETYRNYGHLAARFNPIDPHPPKQIAQLELKSLGFEESELDQNFPALGLFTSEEVPLRDIIGALQETYCGKVGLEYVGLQRLEMEKWIEQQIEPNRFAPQLTIDEKKRILSDLNRAELFETFLHTKYVGQKRFSIEGGETTIPLLHTLIEHGAELGADEFVFGMAHRGRLNVLANILNKSYVNIFHEFQDTLTREAFEGSGDVKYHKGFSADIVTSHGKKVHLSVTANPSHLESVDPVVQGQVRAKQVKRGDEDKGNLVVPILIHGDASVAGQGVVYETLQMYRLAGYGVGGTIHVVINNQIGFTTLPKDSRSTRYCTDIARAFGAPVFHVNGEDPEGCARAAKLAMEIRHRFHCDVFIDLNCHRKYGHNEADEPAFTQPLEYQMIRQKQSARVIYRDQLISQGVVEKKIAEQLEADFTTKLQAELEGVQALETEPEPDAATPEFKEIREANATEDPFHRVETAVSAENLRRLTECFTTVPEGFNLHRKILRLVEDRRKLLSAGEDERVINWGTAEHLAFATLLDEGSCVRLSGQDSRRGTFNHRHAMWMDQKREAKYFPLSHLSEGQARFDVFNSLLSEYAALAFEFGYSLSSPSTLVIWEAQFGDFANGAQVVADQYISTSEQKWGRVSGLVLLLPHGYEGQGPEHSSARVERYLQLAGDLNMRVTNPTTPAQMFHLLRRQQKRKSRRPLIVFTPKSLFGNPKCVSALSDMTKGTFEEVLDDPLQLTSARQLVFCSGKVYYDLDVERERRERSDTVIIRLEQLYPLHQERVTELVKKYGDIDRYLWVQEEPCNMGAWDFIRHQMKQLLPEGKDLEFVGRERSASPATGSPRKHKEQLQQILDSVYES